MGLVILLFVLLVTGWIMYLMFERKGGDWI